ncbi:MAG: prepilin-type N-terminal cleavage/methylation domain-containing protein [Candidatus Omnitrophota bacterium]
MGKKGFTLLEIVIVIIIIGVMTGLALPKLASMIKASHASEAIQAFNIINKSMQRCLMMNDINESRLSACASLWDSGCFGDFDDLGISNPFDSPGSHFSFTGSFGGSCFTNITGSLSYCYSRLAALKGGSSVDFLRLLYCSGSANGTTCANDLCLKVAGGTTIGGSGVFKGVKIGPGIIN